MKIKALIFIMVGSGTVLFAQQTQPPMPPSPIKEFRELLKQSPEERKIALARRSEKSRIIIEQKLQEYQTLAPEERERRLDATEVQWYLKPLLKMPRPQRDSAVNLVSPLWQPMVMNRLAEWDKMSPELQKEALDHQSVVEYLSRPAPQQAAVFRSLSKEEQDEFIQRVARWKRLPESQRTHLDQRLSAFFNMREEKQQQTLNDFSEDERKNMERTLQAFRQLAPAQRDLCIRSFAAFANMKREEQIAFLKNADRWQAMSPKERAMWKQVVSIVPPMPTTPAPQPPVPLR